MSYLLWFVVSLACALWCILVYGTGEFGLGTIGIGAKNPRYVRRSQNPIGFWFGIVIAAMAAIASGAEAIRQILELHHFKL